MRSVPRLCEFNPGICLTTEEKHGKTSVRVVKECCFPFPKHPHHNNTHHIHTHIITYYICEIFHINKFGFGVAIGPNSFASRPCRLNFFYIIFPDSVNYWNYIGPLCLPQIPRGIIVQLFESVFSCLFVKSGLLYNLYLGSNPMWGRLRRSKEFWRYNSSEELHSGLHS